MATSPPSSPSSAVVIDANVAIAIASKETGRETKARTELSAYAAKGYLFYAPGTIIAEALFVLCRKHATGVLDAAAYAGGCSGFQYADAKCAAAAWRRFCAHCTFP